MKKKKIAIIAHNCRTGGGLFGTLNLLKAFKNVAQDEQILLVCSAGYGYEGLELPPNSDFYVYQGSHSPLERTWFERLTLPKIIKRYNPDVILGLANIGLTKPHVPQALIIRQAYLIYDKRYYSEIHWLWQLRIAALRSQIKKSLPATDLVFAQTPIVKRRFSETFHYPENQINILRWPPPTEINPAVVSEIPDIFDRSSGDFYVLLLTRYMAHRNPSVLIPICRLHGEQIRAKQIKFITTVERQDHQRAGKFLEEISKYHLEDVIINVGSLSREDVARYLFYSDVFWLPTTLETLGLPFMEAMVMGVPILAPDLDFARYVCGEAACYYDPWNTETAFEKILLLREDATIRQKLIDKGKTQLANRSQFAENWEEVAKDLIQDLRALAEKR